MFNYADILYSHDDDDINAFMKDYEVVPTNSESEIIAKLLNTSDLKPVSIVNFKKFMQKYSPLKNIVKDFHEALHVFPSFAYVRHFDNNNKFKAFTKVNNNKNTIITYYNKTCEGRLAEKNYVLEELFKQPYFDTDNNCNLPMLNIITTFTEEISKLKLNNKMLNPYVKTIQSTLSMQLVLGYFMRCFLHLAKIKNIDINACKHELEHAHIGLFSDDDIRFILDVDVNSAIHLLPSALNNIKNLYISFYFASHLCCRCSDVLINFATMFLNLYYIVKDYFSFNAIVSMLYLEYRTDAFYYTYYEIPRLAPFYCLGLIIGGYRSYDEFGNSDGDLLLSLRPINYQDCCYVDPSTSINTMAQIYATKETKYNTTFKHISNFNRYLGSSAVQAFVDDVAKDKSISKEYDKRYALILYAVTVPQKKNSVALVNISKVPIPTDTKISCDKFPNSVYAQIVSSYEGTNKMPKNIIVIAASYYNPFIEQVIKTFPMSEHVKKYYATKLQALWTEILGQRYYNFTPHMFSEYYKVYEAAATHIKNLK